MAGKLDNSFMPFWVLEGRYTPPALIDVELRGDLALAIETIGKGGFRPAIARHPSWRLIRDDSIAITRDRTIAFSQVGLFITKLDLHTLARAAALWLFGVPIRTD
ncbi:MAG: hypothetical protein EOS71_08340 [Mesorhizobium sp.]|nr:hypothetical protein EOA35_03430 [Mesorhizobium sp. M8A.F.Ca.ET.023.01.1.1]RWC76365.1 MAG: hypothetical protein EOS71_08340 [Mesorhizobium sp.]